MTDDNKPIHPEMGSVFCVKVMREDGVCIENWTLAADEKPWTRAGFMLSWNHLGRILFDDYLAENKTRGF